MYQKFVIDVGLNYGLDIFYNLMVGAKDPDRCILCEFCDILGQYEIFYLLHVGEILLR